MDSEVKILKLEKEELLPEDTNVYMVEDGTIFYVKYSAPMRLYVKWNGKVVESNISNKQILSATKDGFTFLYLCTCKNEMYYVSDSVKKIYKASFTPTKGIDVVCHRETRKDETFCAEGSCFKMQDTRKALYRICDDPDRDSVYLADDQTGYIHKGKLIMIEKSSEGVPPSASREGEHIVIAIPETTDGFGVQETEQFIYLFHHHMQIIYTIDNKTLEFLQLLKIECNGQEVNFLGIYKGEIRCVITENKNECKQMRYIATTQLPHGYFDKNITIDEREITRLENRIKELESIQKLITTEKDEIIRKNAEREKEIELKMEKLGDANNELLKEKKRLEDEKLEIDRNMGSELNNQKMTYEEEKLELQQIICILRNEKSDLAKQCHQNHKLNETLTSKYNAVLSENEQIKLQMSGMEAVLYENKVKDLRNAKSVLNFQQLEKCDKPIAILDNGNTLFFDNKRSVIFMNNMSDGNRKRAHLEMLGKDNNFSFRGTIGNCVYFSIVCRNKTRVFSINFDSDPLLCDQINEITSSEFSLFKTQPLYFKEQGRQWYIYHYREKYDDLGEKFDISEVKSLSQHEPHYHKEVLYLFRYHSEANVNRVNEKVVTVEGPLLDLEDCSFYSSLCTDYICILNSNLRILILLRTNSLTVSQLAYELPVGSIHHWIVGIHDGTLRMAFEMKSEEAEGTSEFRMAKTQLSL